MRAITFSEAMNALRYMMGREVMCQIGTNPRNGFARRVIVYGATVNKEVNGDGAVWNFIVRGQVDGADSGIDIHDVVRAYRAETGAQ